MSEERINDMIYSLIKKIKELEEENRSLKARINYIQNSSDKSFIPPENSPNRGED